MSPCKKDFNKFWKDINEVFSDLFDDFAVKLDSLTKCTESKCFSEELSIPANICDIDMKRNLSEDSSVTTKPCDLEKERNESDTVESQLAINVFEGICPFSANKINVCYYNFNADMDLMNKKYRCMLADPGSVTSDGMLNRSKMKDDKGYIGKFMADEDGLFSFIYNKLVKILIEKVIYSDDAWWTIKNCKTFLTGNIRYGKYLSIKQGLLYIVWTRIFAADYIMLDYVQEDYFFPATFWKHSFSKIIH